MGTVEGCGTLAGSAEAQQELRPPKAIRGGMVLRGPEGPMILGGGRWPPFFGVPLERASR